MLRMICRASTVCRDSPTMRRRRTRKEPACLGERGGGMAEPESTSGKAELGVGAGVRPDELPEYARISDFAGGGW